MRLIVMKTPLKLKQLETVISQSISIMFRAITFYKSIALEIVSHRSLLSGS